nr:hypothetical protein GCM10020093_100490 [Planobispora longispora]
MLRGELRPAPGPVAAAAPARRERRPRPRPGDLIGREPELAAVRGTLAPGRIVTLVGPGGVGKTRLAQQVADDYVGEHGERGEHGEHVFWADLASLRDAAALPYTVAAAVGLEVEPGVAVVDALGEWAGTARGLLVLDNCEHLLPAVPELVDRMPGVSALATSREPLGVAGNTSWTSRRWSAATRSSCSGPGSRSPDSPPSPARRSGSPRSAGRWTGCRWPWSWRRPGSARSPWTTSPAGWTGASRCCAVPTRRAVTARWRR